MTTLDGLKRYGIRDMVDRLSMERHPIAGWYVTHYSDSETLGRPRFTSIYYLLAGDEAMPPHKSDGVEVWHFHLGAPAEFVVSNGGDMRLVSTLGRDIAVGQQPQLAIPPYLLQSCRSLGDWTLLGCTASPGFSPRTTPLIDADD